jgi:hypothetical protein
MIFVSSQNISKQYNRPKTISIGSLSFIFTHLLEILQHENSKGGQGDVSNKIFLSFSSSVTFILS